MVLTTILNKFISKCNVNAVTKLIDYGADVNYKWKK